MPDMKKSQNSVISVLLFSFIFLAIHDFAMIKIDSCNHYEVSSKVTHLVDDIHEKIHTLFAIDAVVTLETDYILTAFKPNFNIFIITSNHNHVLERPPLS